MNPIYFSRGNYTPQYDVNVVYNGKILKAKCSREDAKKFVSEHTDRNIRKSARIA